MHLRKRARWAAAALATAVLALVGSAAVLEPAASPQAAACPPGYKGGANGLCVTAKHPEPLFELIQRQEFLESVRSAPFDQANPDAYPAALEQKKSMTTSVKGTEGAWKPVGSGPLIVNHPDYSSVNGLGLVHNQGRIDRLEYDPVNKRLFAAKGTGGVWMSTNLGDSWTSIGDTLPSQVVGAVAWSSANGGTVLAISGDPTYGAGGYAGYGAFYSNDLGQTWQTATGVPNGALGFEIEVDPNAPNVVYAATSKGLFRSADGGRSYVNVKLPTGDCAGVEGGGKCQLANMVTDVVIRGAGGVNGDVAPGTVLAVVGWRASDRKDSDGNVQSPGNGLYRSATGEAGTFEKVAASGWPSATRQGRVEFGPTTGAKQDKDFLYAIVQDAAALNGQLDVIDVSVSDPRGGMGTVLNGIYVSADFGKTWTLMADDNAIAKSTTTGSALVGTGQALGFEPGVQAWYNEFIAPDPTRQTADGIPTRLAFGLEEVWQNELPVPMNAPTTFKVIGRYFSDETCLFLSTGLPECPTNRPPTTSTTTHPDQQAGVWIPHEDGGVTLAVGNDGGFYKAHAAPGAEIDNGDWGDGHQAGFNTLLPYDVAVAKDGTVWAGLQDNGHMKITPTGEQYETYGGDGTFAEVDPDNSKIAYEAYVYADMSVTTDGGKSWRAIAPTLTNTRFVNPFEMDSTDANHLVTGGNEIVETTAGPNTADGAAENAWTQVFDLGTQSQPGSAAAVPSTSDPANQMSAVDVHGDAIYVGFCGVCDILNAKASFKSGIATNVGGLLAPKRKTSNGWHVASATGLPNRFITSIAIHPKDIRTIYVTLGGYSRRWVPPGTLQDTNTAVGEGHVFVSRDAGETFTDISGNLPDVPATWVTLRGQQVIVGTDIGVFASDTKGGTTYGPLAGLPVVPISTMNLRPNNPDELFVATYGRGVWAYTFAKSLPGKKTSDGTTTATPPPAETGTTPLAPTYGFELTDEGWTAASTSLLSGWKRGSPGHDSGTAFQVLPYTDATTATLASPVLAHTGGWVYLDFRNQRDTEPGYDFLTVEYSTDGATWSSIPWRFDFATKTWTEGGGLDGKNVSYPAFDLERVAFEAPAGNVQVRFKLASDELISAPLYTGVAVDAVSLTK